MKRQNIYKQIALSLLLLVGMAGTAWGQDSDSPNYVTGDKYQRKEIKATPKEAKTEKDGEEGLDIGAIINNQEIPSGKTWWKAANNGNVSITISFEKEYTFSSLRYDGGNESNERAASIIVKDSNDTDSDGQEISITDTGSSLNVPIPHPITANSLELTITPKEGSTIAIDEIEFWGLPTIQHKKAKWHDQRTGSNFVDSFSDNIEFFLTENNIPTNIEKQPQIQATHTIVDTLYVKKGTNIILALPDRQGGINVSNASTNIGSYQRWYNFRTGNTFQVNATNVNVVDLLTPPEGTFHRFANGYVNRPIENWNGTLASRMQFYYPTDNEYNTSNMKTQNDNKLYLVACDVSGYTDFSKDSKTSGIDNFGNNNEYWEPTLSHRVIYYIVGVNEIPNINNTKVEEYEINLPAYILPNSTHEMVALSMDARSYLAKTGATTLTASVNNNNNAGIKLYNNNAKNYTDNDTEATSVTLSGDDRAIFIKYPNTADDFSMYVNGLDDNGTPTATIEVKADETLVATFTLTFRAESRLLSQTMINQLDGKNGSLITGEPTWKNLTYRTPDHMDNTHILLTELNFDYDESLAQGATGNENYYPYPLAWDNNTYGFFDGTQVGHIGGTNQARHYPEYGAYSILKSDSYIEVGGWAWPKDNNEGATEHKPTILTNSSEQESTYHLYADASDRPGIISRLRFEENLCRGSVLYVSAWVKSARWRNSTQITDNAAMLFTIMGVRENNGNVSYTPIYRHQTGQIPATYASNNRNLTLPGMDGTDDNEWYQTYFSFVNSNDIEYDYYILQIDNNSASTQGGDMYLDDVRVYIARPMAQVQQLETACSTKRTLMNLQIQWDRLVARTGIEGSNETKNIGICFIDTLQFHNTYNGSNFQEALEASAVELGQGDNSYKFRVLNYNTTFASNEDYTKNKEGGNLAADNNDAFYRYTSETNLQSLAVDFYSALIPGRAYWIVLEPNIDSNDITEQTIGDKIIHIISNPETVFADFNTDACAIKADFKVRGNTTVKVDGQIPDPENTQFCKGNIVNFTVDLEVPSISNPDETITISNGVLFDWFFGEARNGEVADPESQFIEQNSTYGCSLQEALSAFRNLYPTATELDETETAVVEDVFTENMYNIIDYYLNDATAPTGAQNRPLVLGQPTLNITLLENMRVVIQPIRMSVSTDDIENWGYDESDWLNLCWGYTYVELTTTDAAPSVHAGFNIVKYPKEGYEPALRIGLKQIEKVSTKNTEETNKTLTVDLRDATSYKGESETDFELQLIQKSNQADEIYNKMYMTDTNDPDMKKYITDQGDDFDNMSLPIGTVTDFSAHHYGEGTTRAHNQMKIRFNLNEQTLQINGEEKTFQFIPREGYYYTFNVYFEEKVETGETACPGHFPIIMKVVPEYLIWEPNSEETENGTLLGNWNNDKNWKRVNDGSRINKNDYSEDNTETGYVPMLFSKVIMPRDSKVHLYAAGYSENGTEWTGSNNIPEDVGAPTDSIQYDLMVFEHTSETAASGNVSDGDYATERYRVSLCDEIHFEPGAQMLHPEYLLYNKAWVDYELEEGKWYTLASPLHGVVAGDFYTDKSGKEDAEYFTELEFGTDHSRFEPSVYQRAWKSSGATMEQVGEGNDSERAIAGNWSAVYNNVYESYDEGTGFSLKVLDVKSSDGKALFRLPKADDSYNYYNSSTDNTGTTATGTLKRGEKAGRLKSDVLYTRNTNMEDATKGTDITITLADQNGESEYYLVENPFMSSLNMVEFFETNKDVLLPKYWLVNKDNQTVAVGSDNGWVTNENESITSIAPLQSFFVQKNDGATSKEIKFTADMQTLSEKTSDEGSNSLILTAKTADGKVSRAAIAYDMSADKDYAADEDAELFLDSNLSDVPTIYTVAGTMATSINRTSELYNIPVGIYGHSTEMVTLSFEGLKHFSSATLYDAEKKTETPLREGTTLTVPASTSGRYFLRAGTPTGNEVLEADDIQIYTLSGNRVMVTSATPLKDIRVYNLGGALTKHVKAGVCSFELYLPDGIYIVTAENANGEAKTAKVSVR